MARFAIGDHAVITRGPLRHGYVDLDDDDPDRYHHLIVGSLVRIKDVFDYAHPAGWGFQYAAEPLDPDAWANHSVSDRDWQYVFDIHLSPAATVDTSDITEIEKFLAT